MFERNRIDTGAQQQVPVAVEIIRDDGTVLKGRFIVSASRAFCEVLNGQGQFLEFEPHGGPRCYLAKSTLKSVTVVNAPDARQLQNRRHELEGFEPFAVLGLAPGAPFDEVRHAYLTLSKIYHPDRYQSVELPAEVRDYLVAMAKRINTAYAALERVVAVDKSRVSNRVEPIFTTGPR